MMPKTYYRSVFLSDTHLYSRGAHADELADFIQSFKCRYLYLVGDIVDLWQLNPRRLTSDAESMERRRFWLPLFKNHDREDRHIRAIRAILKKAQKGAEVYYLPGNHDDFFRNFIGLRVLGVHIGNDLVHETVDGKRYFVTHGDKFDVIVKHHRLLALVASVCYDNLVLLNRIVNKVRMLMGKKKWSFSRYIQQKVKKSVQYICDFEREICRVARSRGADGVICGHIHNPVVKAIDGMTYHNCGDWVEHLTAIAETEDGRLELIHYDPEAESPLWPELLDADPLEPEPAYDPVVV